jgi:hypothetical protein
VRNNWSSLDLVEMRWLADRLLVNIANKEKLAALEKDYLVKRKVKREFENSVVMTSTMASRSPSIINKEPIVSCGVNCIVAVDTLPWNLMSELGVRMLYCKGYRPR